MSNKTTKTLYYLASVLFYIVAITKFGTDTSSGVMWMSLGTVFLCLGSSGKDKE